VVKLELAIGRNVFMLIKEPGSSDRYADVDDEALTWMTDVLTWMTKVPTYDTTEVTCDM